MSRLSEPQARALRVLGHGPLLRYPGDSSWKSAAVATDRFRDTTLEVLWGYDLLYYRGETARLTDRGSLVLSLMKACEPYRLTKRKL